MFISVGTLGLLSATFIISAITKEYLPNTTFSSYASYALLLVGFFACYEVFIKGIKHIYT
jgi:hypothetical protein